MRVGVPRERKDGERRVGLLPEGVAVLVASGHVVLVERGAGERVGFDDSAYARAGADIVADGAEIFGCALIVKVKELQRSEWPMLQPGTVVFAFAQFGRDRELLAAALGAGIGCIAYETVAAHDGTLPLLAPMSRIAGRLAPLIAASLLMSDRGGSGVLLPGLDGVPAGRVVIVGAGNVGGEAARVAAGMGCSVRVFGRSAPRLAVLRKRCAGDVEVAGNDPAMLASAIAGADVVIGAVLQPGKLSPKLVTREMVRAMRGGSVLIDVGIDQGGIAHTSRMTSLSDPTYVEEGVTHYCVPNMPALVARTATLALTCATLPYVRALADQGIDAALAADAGLRAGLQIRAGAVTHAGLAADCDLPLARA